MSNGGVIVSFWRYSGASESSGTPTDWLTSLAKPLVEVYCQCPATVAAHRFLARQRHPGHLDTRHDREAVVSQFEQQAERGPLGIGTVLIADTGVPVLLETLLQRVQSALDA